MSALELTTRSAYLHLGSKGIQVSGLQIDGSRALKSAGKTLSRTNAGDDTARGHTLHLVLAVPRHKVAIVDEVCLVFAKLCREGVLDENLFFSNFQITRYDRLTSFRMIAPKLWIQSMPVPVIL